MKENREMAGIREKGDRKEVRESERRGLRMKKILLFFLRNLKKCTVFG